MKNRIKNPITPKLTPEELKRVISIKNLLDGSKATQKYFEELQIQVMQAIQNKYKLPNQFTINSQTGEVIVSGGGKNGRLEN